MEHLSEASLLATWETNKKELMELELRCFMRETLTELLPTIIIKQSERATMNSQLES